MFQIPNFISDCFHSNLISNGYCNDETNNAECLYDGGDCCFSNVNKDHCTECICHFKESCATGFLPSSVGDGYCNDETNNPDCNYDGGDCCGSCINTDFCDNCTCFGNTTGNGIPNALVGDGFCNDETNNVHCYYDGLDCCRSPVDETFCSDCSCHGELILFKILEVIIMLIDNLCSFFKKNIFRYIFWL